MVNETPESLVDRIGKIEARYAVDADIRAEFRSVVDTRLSKLENEVHALRADWPEFKATLRSVAELIERVDSRTQKIIDIDRTQGAAEVRIATVERNVTELWQQHAKNENRWRDHDELATQRITTIHAEIAQKTRQVHDDITTRTLKTCEDANASAQKASAKATEAERKADAIMERFKGVSYVWGVVGVAFVAGGMWLVSTVSSLDKKMYAMENAINTVVKIMQERPK